MIKRNVITSAVLATLFMALPLASVASTLTPVSPTTNVIVDDGDYLFSGKLSQVVAAVGHFVWAFTLSSDGIVSIASGSTNSDGSHNQLNLSLYQDTVSNGNLDLPGDALLGTTGTMYTPLLNNLHLTGGTQYFVDLSGGPKFGTQGAVSAISAVSEVPLPAAAWLFGSTLLGFMSMSNRRKV